MDTNINMLCLCSVAPAHIIQVEWTSHVWYTMYTMLVSGNITHVMQAAERMYPELANSTDPADKHSLENLVVMFRQVWHLACHTQTVSAQ